jgi:hypothetical protein
MYTEEDYAPLITKHDIDSEAKYLAKYLNQDVWVITRLLRAYWKDKLAVEWTTEDIKNCHEFTSDLTDNDALEILKRISCEYSRSWGITVEDLCDNIDSYKEDKEDKEDKENDLYVLYPQG